MADLEREFNAIICADDPTALGKRVTIFAESSSAARVALEEIYGKGNVYNVYNEEDAERPR